MRVDLARLRGRHSGGDGFATERWPYGRWGLARRDKGVGRGEWRSGGALMRGWELGAYRRPRPEGRGLLVFLGPRRPPEA